MQIKFLLAVGLGGVLGPFQEMFDLLVIGPSLTHSYPSHVVAATVVAR